MCLHFFLKIFTFFQKSSLLSSNSMSQRQMKLSFCQTHLLTCNCFLLFDWNLSGRNLMMSSRSLSFYSLSLIFMTSKSCIVLWLILKHWSLNKWVNKLNVRSTVECEPNNAKKMLPNLQSLGYSVFLSVWKKLFFTLKKL